MTQTFFQKKDTQAINDAITVCNLANIYSDQGQTKKTQNLHDMNFHTMMQELGFDHLNIINFMNSMTGNSYRNDKYKKTKQFYTEIVERKKKVLGSNHSNTFEA